MYEEKDRVTGKDVEVSFTSIRDAVRYASIISIRKEGEYKVEMIDKYLAEGLKRVWIIVAIFKDSREI